MSRNLDKIKKVLDFVVISLFNNDVDDEATSKDEKLTQAVISVYRPYNEFYTYCFSDGKKKGTITIIQNKDKSTTLLPTGKNQDISKRCLKELEVLIKSGIITWFDYYSSTFDYQIKLSREQLCFLLEGLKTIINVEEPSYYSKGEDSIIIDEPYNNLNLLCENNPCANKSQQGKYVYKDYYDSRVHIFISFLGDKLVITERMRNRKKTKAIDDMSKSSNLNLLIQGKKALLHREMIRILNAMSLDICIGRFPEYGE